MADAKTMLPVKSIDADKPVAISRDLAQNAVGNVIYIQQSDGTNTLDQVVINSAFGATPTVTPIAAKYEATPTTYDDGDAVPILVDANGNVMVRQQYNEYDEDTAHTTADKGNFSLAVRKDMVAEQITTNSSATGDYAGILQDENGSLYVSVMDKNGYANSELHPQFVQIVDTGASSTEVVDYDTVASVAVDATSDHDYTITNAKTFKLKRVFASASGPIKVELQTGLPAGLATQFVGFTSTANPNIHFDCGGLVETLSTGTEIIKLIRTNIDAEDAFDVYSTFMGNEV